MPAFAFSPRRWLQAALPMLVATAAQGGGQGLLNDTGALRCKDPTGARVPCAGSGQDGAFGRDVHATRRADGIAGFRFRRICNSGQPAGHGGCPAEPVLGPAPDDWACTEDRVSGLIWEIKTTDGGLRDVANAYTGSLIAAPDSAPGYERAVNAQGLCGARDWLLPLAGELLSIVRYGGQNPGHLDPRFFPDSAAGRHWTAERHADDPRDEAWTVDPGSQRIDMEYSMARHPVRLVRPAAALEETRFVVGPGGDTVVDAATGLVWRRCVEGHSGGDCIEGTPLELDWFAALAYARRIGGGWRLPNIKELDSIADRMRYPRMLFGAFPSQRSVAAWGPVWSSTPATGSGASAWTMTYDNYDSFTHVAEVTERHYLRLVRDPEESGPR